MLNMHRRDFLKGSVLAAASAQGQSGGRISIVVSPGNALTSAPPARWAVDELKRALSEHSVTATEFAALSEAPAGVPAIVVAGSDSQAAEGLSVSPVNVNGRQVLMAAGRDPRGLVYALLEIADRVRHAADPMAVFVAPKIAKENPANTVRSISRMFVSDVHDKPWFNDREMWSAYLTMLAENRFNRFSLALGIGYDFLRQVTDCYFVFAYPFLLSVPGYHVRAVNLPDDERDRNLAMLKFISEQTALRGMEFQLGLWTHGYQWTNSPNANYTIDGLTAENHASYCRDALRMLMKECPAISGVTFRIHGESGVPEGSYDFWKTVFEGITGCGRKVEIDMHSKGIDQRMVDVGVKAGMPVKVSPKFWAEHMGMPYHQADIRQQEQPKGGEDQGFFALSSGSRSFTRYGYADLLRDGRDYGVLHRIWPGTQRLLLWGDPVFAAGYSRAFRFCGSSGVEIFEPLSFKGRRGSGVGTRTGYADASIAPKWDWQKYEYGYRVWGRLLYNPDADPDGWRRSLRSPAEAVALASASRILPIITTAHCPSAANNNYWPEMYTSQSIVDPNKKHQYSDMPAPKVFGNVSPLDPQLFSTVNDFAAELWDGKRSGKYSPVEVAVWLDDLADTAVKQLALAPAATTPEARRLVLDVQIQAGLGRFFAAKLRAGVLWALFEKTTDRAPLVEALKQYRAARGAWAQLADRAKGVYAADITVGEQPWLRGHWLDRLKAIDDDIVEMGIRIDAGKNTFDPRLRPLLAEVATGGRRTPAPCRHTPPQAFHPNKALDLELALLPGRKTDSARLYYRHVNQAERFHMAEMQAQAGKYRAAIPAEYADSPFALQYYFEVSAAPKRAWLYPGFAPNLANQPYFVVQRGKEA
jgi:hypothetical protein